MFEAHHLLLRPAPLQPHLRPRDERSQAGGGAAGVPLQRRIQRKEAGAGERWGEGEGEGEEGEDHFLFFSIFYLFFV